MSCHQANLNLEKYWWDQESNPELTSNYDSEAYHYHCCQWLAYTKKKYSLQKKQAKHFALNPSKLGSSVAAINVEEEEEKKLWPKLSFGIFCRF